MKKLLFLLLIIGVLGSCKDDVDYRPIDDMLIQDYLTENGIQAIKDEATGVYYRITEEGNGEDFPNVFSTIRTYYKGYLIGGEDDPFDQRIEGEDDYLEIGLNSLVFGWQVALPNFSKNAKGEIYIPSYAGYGNNERSNIPKNSVLIFEVHLVNVFN